MERWSHVQRPPRRIRTLTLSGLLAIAALGAGPATGPTTTPAIAPLLHAHAHNDYAHPHPLADALACGFTSVEADVNLVAGQLLVAHSPNAARPDRTLRSMYLDPLRALAQANGGRIYPGGPPVVLLIDIKTAGEPTYAAIRAELADYAPMLTRVDSTGHRTEGAVTVIMTGNRPRPIIEREPDHLAFVDGLATDLDDDAPAWLMPWVSANWTTDFTWTGRGPMPAADQAKLADWVARAHRHGRSLRLWKAPDSPTAWRALRAAGVDLLNTDHLIACRDYLLSTPTP